MPKTEIYENGVLLRVEDTRTLEEAKTTAVFLIREKYEYLLSQGYYDEVLTVTIGSTSNDQQAFVNDLAGLNAAEASGMVIPTIAFAGLGGQMYEVSVAEYRGLLGRAWAYARQLWGARLMAEAAVAQATTLAEVDAVNFGSN